MTIKSAIEGLEEEIKAYCLRHHTLRIDPGTNQAAHDECVACTQPRSLVSQLRTCYGLSKTESLSEPCEEEPDRWWTTQDLSFWDDGMFEIVEERKILKVDARNVSIIDQYRIRSVS